MVMVCSSIPSTVIGSKAHSSTMYDTDEVFILTRWAKKRSSFGIMARRCPELLADCSTTTTTNTDCCITTNVGGSEDSSDDDDDVVIIAVDTMYIASPPPCSVIQ